MAWWENIVLSIIALGSGWIGAGWFSKRKAKAEAVGKEKENEGTDISNITLQVKGINDIVDTWREAFKDLKSTYDLKYDAIQEQYNYTKRELELLKDVVAQNAAMQIEINQLQAKVRILEQENSRLNRIINSIKKPVS